MQTLFGHRALLEEGERNVLKVSKDYSSDCVFQFLTGIGLVSVAQPFLAISDAHWSDRTGSYEEKSYLEGECKPKLRPMAISGNLLA